MISHVVILFRILIIKHTTRKNVNKNQTEVLKIYTMIKIEITHS